MEITEKPTRVGRYDARARNNQSIQYTGKNRRALINFVATYRTAEAHVSNILWNMNPVQVVRVTNNNLPLSVTVMPGDHLIMSDTGVFYVMPDVMFNLTYNPKG